jgi:methylphosphotriester-DNA--protein-cysteine methyltransferase
MIDHVRDTIVYCQPYPKARRCKSKLREWIASHTVHVWSYVWYGMYSARMYCVLYGPEKTKKRKNVPDTV